MKTMRILSEELEIGLTFEPGPCEYEAIVLLVMQRHSVNYGMAKLSHPSLRGFVCEKD
jgi:hypothetical protein